VEQEKRYINPDYNDGIKRTRATMVRLNPGWADREIGRLEAELSELRKAATKYLNCAIPCMITVYLDDSEHRMLRSAERALRALFKKKE